MFGFPKISLSWPNARPLPKDARSRPARLWVSSRQSRRIHPAAESRDPVPTDSMLERPYDHSNAVVTVLIFRTARARWAGSNTNWLRGYWFPALGPLDQGSGVPRPE